MAKKPLFLLILIVHVSITTAIQCVDIIGESHCIQLTGCLWSSNSCSGQFSPSCVPPSCYYIDSVNLSTDSTGSSENPFQTLTDGLTKLAETTRTLIVINDLESVTVYVMESVTLTSSINIMYFIRHN